MKKSRVLAVVMAVLMMVTLLPSMVFATAAPSGTLDGKLKVKGTLAVGSTLSADYSKVKPEGITDDNVSFSWSLKDGDLLTEVGTDKTYKIDEKDLGLPIVLKITGKEETGVSGELTVTTQEVSATEEEAKALAEKKKEEAKAAGEDPDAEESEASADSESAENVANAAEDTSQAPDSTQPEENTEPAEETESADVQENTDVQESTDAQESADTQESTDTQEPAENSVIEVNSQGLRIPMRQMHPETVRQRHRLPRRQQQTLPKKMRNRHILHLHLRKMEVGSWILVPWKKDIRKFRKHRMLLSQITEPEILILKRSPRRISWLRILMMRH